MKKRRALIVDDEPLGRERVRMLLEEFPSVSVIGECGGGIEAVAQIKAQAPDIVFLDIQMPDLDGFGVLAELRAQEAQLPIIIFVTAYDEHAVKAFEVNAIDYLLKPVQAERLGIAIDRAQALLDQPNQGDRQTNLTDLLSTLDRNKSLTRIEIRSQGRTDYVNVRDVYLLKADGNYIEVHTAGHSRLARITLAELESQLDPKVFIRVSRSAVINLDRVVRIQSVGRRGHAVVLDDGRTVPVKRSLETLQERLKYAP